MRVAFRRRQSRNQGSEALFDESTIDAVALSPDRSTAHLYIVADSAWTGSDEQITSLQAKIHGYVSFALDGQMARMYPETQGLGWRIVIDSQVGAPDTRSSEVIEQVAEAVRRYGGDLVVQ